MKIFRLFISSTFNDMDRERLLLHKRVFPQLKALCTRYGARFNPVDLRWGVNEHAQQDFQTMALCLREVARCQRESKRPNFLILLGDRYGWEPVPTAIEEQEFQKLLIHTTAEDQELLNRAYQLDENAIPAMMVPKFDLKKWFQHESKLLGILRTATKQSDLAERDQAKYLYSATHQEIIQGLYLSDSEVSPEQTAHVMACLRALPDLDRGETSLLYDGKDQQVAELKKIIEARLAAKQGGGAPRLYHYQAEVQNAHTGAVNFDEEAFVQAILAHLTPIIEEELIEANESEEPAPLMVQELRSQRRFREERANHFTGRVTELNVIKNYIQKTEIHNDEEMTRKPLAIIAKGGTGKSALVAEAIAQLDVELKTEGQKQVFFCFAGASPRSFKLLSILETLTTQLNEELMGRYDGDPPELKLDFSDEYNAFDSFNHALKLLSDAGGVVIFIDALDQLYDQASDIKRWLSSVESIPSNVSLILSALPTLAEVTTPHCSIYDLPALDLSSGATLLDLWLAVSQRSLNEAQKAYLLSLYEASGEVLALKLLALRAQSWKSFSTIPNLPNHSEALVDLYLKDLERAHNPSLKGKVNPFIERILGLMVSSRWGLTEDELFEIPMSDETFFADFQASSHHELPAQEVPAVMRSRLWFDLSPFLSAKLIQDELVYLFHHRVFNEVAQVRYREINNPQSYQWLLNYYENLPLRVDQNQKTHLPNPRPLIELPHALFMTNQREKLWQYLTKFDTLMALCEAGLAELISTDYQRAWTTRNDDEYDQFYAWESFFREYNLFLLHEYPRWGSHKVLLQFAMEHAEESPVTFAAEKWLKEGMCDWKWSYNKTRPRKPYVSPLLMSMIGHKETVSGVIELKNKNLVSWSDENILRLWSSEGKELATFEKHDKSIEKVIEVENNQILSISNKDKIILWSHKGKVLDIIEDVCLGSHHQSSERLFETEDGNIVLCAERKIILYSVLKGSLESLGEYVCNHNIGNIRQISKSRLIILFGNVNRESLIILSFKDGEIRVIKRLESEYPRDDVLELVNGGLVTWRYGAGAKVPLISLILNNGENCIHLDGHHDWSGLTSVNGVKQLNNGNFISWSSDKTIIIYSNDGTKVAILKGHKESVIGVLELKDGRILSWSHDHTFRLWSGVGKALATFEINGLRFYRTIQLKNGNLISWCPHYENEFDFYLWSVEKEIIIVFKGHKSFITDVQELKDGRLLSYSSDNTIRLWSQDTTKYSQNSIDQSCKLKNKVSLSKNRIASWYYNTLTIWSSKGEMINIFKGHDLLIRGVIELKDYRILTWSHDDTIRLWSSEGEELSIMRGHQWHRKGSIRGVIELKNGRLVSWSYDSTLRLWSSEGELLAVLNGHQDRIEGVLELKNGKILSWSKDDTLRLWSNTGKELAIMNHIKDDWVGSIENAIELRDGQLLSWHNGNDFSIRLWSKEGKAIRSFRSDCQIDGILLLKNNTVLSWSPMILWSLEGIRLTEFHMEDVDIERPIKVLELENNEILSIHQSCLRLWSIKGETLAVLKLNGIKGVKLLDHDKILYWTDGIQYGYWELNMIHVHLKNQIARPDTNYASFGLGGIIDRQYIGPLDGAEDFGYQSPYVIFNQGFIRLMNGAQEECQDVYLEDLPIPRKKELLEYFNNPDTYYKDLIESNSYIHPNFELSICNTWPHDFRNRHWDICSNKLNKLINLNTTLDKTNKSWLRGQHELVIFLNALTLKGISELEKYYKYIPYQMEKGCHYIDMTRLANKLKSDKLYSESYWLYNRELQHWHILLKVHFEFVSQSFAEYIDLCIKLNEFQEARRVTKLFLKHHPITDSKTIDIYKNEDIFESTKLLTLYANSLAIFDFSWVQAKLMHSTLYEMTDLDYFKDPPYVTYGMRKVVNGIRYLLTPVEWLKQVIQKMTQK